MLYANQAFEEAVKKSNRQDYNPGNHKPYLHFQDFLFEQGSRPLTDLTNYASFIEELINRRGLDIVEYIPNTKDLDNTVLNWFTQKSNGLSLIQLEPFSEIVFQLVAKNPIEGWQFIYQKASGLSLEELTPWIKPLSHLVNQAGFCRPRPPFPLRGEPLLLPDGSYVYDQISQFLISKLEGSEAAAYIPYTELISNLLLFEALGEQRLPNLIESKFSGLNFLELAPYWKILNKIKGDNEWEWFVSQSESFSLKELEPWIPFLINSDKSDKVTGWIFARAKAEEPQTLNAWADLIKTFETNSTTFGNGATFFKHILAGLPLDQLKVWKVLLAQFHEPLDTDPEQESDIRWAYNWLLSKIIQTTGRADLEALNEWKDVLADFVWRTKDQSLLRQMVSDIFKLTDSVEGWSSIDEWVYSLLNNLHKLDVDKTEKRNYYLSLLERFKQVVAENPATAYPFGKLLSAFISELDFVDVRVWVKQLITDSTQLKDLDTWKHLLGANDDCFQPDILKLFSKAGITDVIGWEDYLEQATRTIMGESLFSYTNARIDLLIKFSKEVLDNFGKNSIEHFGQLFEIYKRYVLSLPEGSVGLMHSSVRMKGILNHMVMDLTEGKPFTLEIPKTAGRLFIWFDGSSTHGLTITNMMTPTAYRAWQKAHDLQIPTAPILGTRELLQTQQIPEIFKGTKLVDTRMVGIKVSSLSYAVKQKIGREVIRQQKIIRESLIQAGINYTDAIKRVAHDRDHNYLIELIDRKYFEVNGGWLNINSIPYLPDKFSIDIDTINKYETSDDETFPWVLVVRIIDWDYGYLEEDKEKIDRRFDQNHDGSDYNITLG